jgi:hypothetical protein
MVVWKQHIRGLDVRRIPPVDPRETYVHIIFVSHFLMTSNLHSRFGEDHHLVGHLPILVALLYSR